jgi:hypothetical protein
MDTLRYAARSVKAKRHPSASARLMTANTTKLH